MSDSVFCPECHNNVGHAIYVIGCPCCGYKPDEDEDLLVEDSE